MKYFVGAAVITLSAMLIVRTLPAPDAELRFSLAPFAQHSRDMAIYLAAHGKLHSFDRPDFPALEAVREKSLAQKAALAKQRRDFGY